MEIPIIYEDSELLAVNKPAGIAVHSDGKNKEETLSDWAVSRNPKMREVGEPFVLSSGTSIARSGIVHRLDKDTSGVMLLAKTQEAFLFLKNLFQQRAVRKTYHAIVYSAPNPSEGIIDKPIARSAKNFKIRATSSQDMRGVAREAYTEYKTLATSKEYAYLETIPKTGRTHQIRVHLKSIGHPVVCDALYAKKRVCPNPPGRLALHALSLELDSPAKTRLFLEAPLPGALRDFAWKEFPNLLSC